MRHRKRGRKLSRTSAHRKAMRQNLAKALLEHERIITTPAKAKEAKPFVEKLITLARKAQPYKNAGGGDERARYVHFYRLAMKKLQDKKLVQKLFGEGPWREGGSLAERYADRPSGQTRIIRMGGSRLGTSLGYAIEESTEIDYKLAGKERTMKLTGNRLGDNAKQVIFELVRQGEHEPQEEVAPEIDITDAAVAGDEIDADAQAGAEELQSRDAPRADEATGESEESSDEEPETDPEQPA